MQEWLNSIQEAFQTAVQSIINYLPQILAGLIILIIGIAIAAALAKLTRKALEMLRIDKFLDRIGVEKYLKRMNENLTVAGIIAWMVKWFIILLTLILVAESLRLEQVTEFLQEVLLYIPNVIAATAILLIGFTIGSAIENAISSSLKGMNVRTSELVATVAKWSIYIFTVMLALAQLRIAPDLMNTLLAGFVAMIAIGGGLAFGLGGKDLAHDLLERMRNDLRESPGAKR